MSHCQPYLLLFLVSLLRLTYPTPLSLISSSACLSCLLIFSSSSSFSVAVKTSPPYPPRRINSRRYMNNRKNIFCRVDFLHNMHEVITPPSASHNNSCSSLPPSPFSPHSALWNARIAPASSWDTA